MATDTAAWYYRGMPAKPLRRALVRALKVAFAAQALLCTDQDAPPE